MKKTRLIVVILILSVAAIGGAALFIGNEAGYAAEGETSAQQNPQAMPADVQVMKTQTLQIWRKYSGHVVAVEQADIRPQVSGRITDVRFEGGQHVEKGDVLVVIDPRPYEASLNKAEAALAAAKTAADFAEKEYQRAKTLIGSEAISQGLLDERTNNRQTAAAAVKGAQALVDEAEINLDYAYVKAPIAGKVSRVETTEGNLVQAGAGAPLLTSIVADEKVYVDFEVDERSYIDLARHLNAESDVPVRLNLSGGDVVFEGVIQSFDNKIDVASGTVRARALLDNKNGILLPGMSVSVEMGSAGDQQHIVLTERAIGTDQDRKFVYLVNDKNVAEYREVKIGQSINGQRVILSGLEDGDKVITEGIVRIRPGVLIAPQIKGDDKKEGAMPPVITTPESDDDMPNGKE